MEKPCRSDDSVAFRNSPAFLYRTPTAFSTLSHEPTGKEDHEQVQQYFIRNLNDVGKCYQ
jgi:hypothetical protein